VPSPDIITVEHPIRLDGTPDAPVVINVRTDEDFARALPRAVRRDFRSVASWTKRIAAPVLGVLRPTTP
jgi:hypothetical protein